MSSVQTKSPKSRFGKIASLVAVAAAGAMLFTACGHRDHFKKDRSEKMVKKMDRIADHLELDGEQMTKYQDLRQRVLADLKAGHASRLEGLREIKAEFEKETPNMDSLAKQLETRITGRQSIIEKAPGYAAEFYNILNDEQKADVRKFVLDKLERL